MPLQSIKAFNTQKIWLGKSWILFALFLAGGLASCNHSNDNNQNGETSNQFTTSNEPPITQPITSQTLAFQGDHIPFSDTATLAPFSNIGSIASAILGEKLYLANRDGRVYEITGRNKAELVVDIRKRTIVRYELGLLGLAISPDGKYLYLSFSDTDAITANGGIPPNLIAAAKVSELGTKDPEIVELVPIIEISQPAGNHNGGDIHFSPKDGYFYISLGDGGGANDQFGNGQNTNSLLGSILRIDPKPESLSGEKYEIPTNNPFFNDPKRRPEIWAYGIRNAWRMAFHPESGDLWVGDVGQNKLEEINVIPNGMGGLNLGWNQYEGVTPFAGAVPNISNHHPPIFQYPHTQVAPLRQSRCSITGGHIYTGNALPTLKGKYLYADFCASGVVWAYDPASPNDEERGDIVVAFDVSIGAIINFGKTPSGETLVGTTSGTYLLTSSPTS